MVKNVSLNVHQLKVYAKILLEMFVQIINQNLEPQKLNVKLVKLVINLQTEKNALKNVNMIKLRYHAKVLY